MEATETRELRYFVAVAEELNFGRAAERLGIAQPPLSRAIAKLERRLGVSLLDRSTRQITLTSAGEVLLIEGRRALDAVMAATQRAQRAAQPRLILAVKPGGDGGLLPEIMSRHESRPGAVPVDLAFNATLWPGKAGSLPVVQGTGELTQLVALGRLLAVVPESIRGRVPAGVTCRDAPDAPVTTLVIAWPRDSRSPQVAAFVQAAIDVAEAR